MQNPYCVGKEIYLRHPSVADVEGRWYEWFSDEQTTRWLPAQQWPNSVESQREFYDLCKKSKERLVLSIVHKKSDKHIGVCNLSSINWVHRYCDLAIVIGEPEYRAGPCVLEAMSLLLRVAFGRFNMRNVKSSYAASNEAAQAIHAILRFKEVGRLPGLLWDRGQYVDLVTTVLSGQEWLANRDSIDSA